MDLKKILGIGIPLTLSSIFGFGQKDTTFIKNDTITNIKCKGDSIILEKKYTLDKGAYRLFYEKTSNLEKGRLLYTSEVNYSYKRHLKSVDYYDKKTLGENFKGRTEEDKFEDQTLLTFYQYDEKNELNKIISRERKGSKKKSNTEYYFYRGENGQKVKWKDINNNGVFDGEDKMYVLMGKKWVELKPEENKK